jgi:hypothetical protein
MPLPKTRKGPASAGRPLPNNITSGTHPSLYRPQDGYAAPTAEDRREAALLAIAAELGYRLATTCLDCGHWISSPISIAAHRGPRCRARAEGRRI